MKKAIVALTIIATSVSLLGCWDLRPVEDLSILVALAIDLAPNGRDLLISGVEPLYQQPRTDQSKTVSVVAADIGEAIDLFQLQAIRDVKAGKVILYLFGEDFWRSGRIVEVARSMFVRADFSLTGLVACVKGPAHEALKRRPPELNQPGIFIWQALNAARDDALIPLTMLIDVAREWPHHEDFWFPMLEVVKELETVRIAGSVVFRGVWPVGELTVSETLDLAHIANEVPGHAFQVGLTTPEGVRLGAHVNRSHLRTNLSSVDGRQVIEVANRFHVTLATPIDLATDVREALSQFRDAISSELTGRGEKILRKLQALDSDPLGLTAPGPFTDMQKAQKDRDNYKHSDLIYRANASITVLGGQ